MRTGKVAVILAVDEIPWTEIEAIGPNVQWITVSQDTLDEAMEFFKEKERASDQGTVGGGGTGDAGRGDG